MWTNVLHLGCQKNMEHRKRDCARTCFLWNCTHCCDCDNGVGEYIQGAKYWEGFINEPVDTQLRSTSSSVSDRENASKAQHVCSFLFSSVVPGVSAPSVVGARCGGNG